MNSGLPQSLFHHIRQVGAVNVGDEIAYVGRRYDRSKMEWVTPDPDDRDWLRVSCVDAGGGVWGYRVNPEDWEREVEFGVYPTQIAEAGVLRRA